MLRKKLTNNDIIPFGLIEWNMKKDTIRVCSDLAETIAFPNKRTTQKYSDFRQLTHPEDIIPFELLAKEIKESKGKYIVIENRKLCRDGTWRWFSIRGKVTKRDKDGEPLQAIGTCTDVTYFKEIDTEFQQMKLLFSEIQHIKHCNTNCEECYFENTFSKRTCGESFICTEILRSLEKITSSSRSNFIFSSNDNTHSNGHTLYNHKYEDIDVLPLSNEKKLFIKTIYHKKMHTIQNSENTSFLGIHLNLPLNQQGIIILERESPFKEETLNFLSPFIDTITHIVSFRRLQINYNELENIASFFITQIPAPVAMFDTNMCYKFASNAWCKSFNLASPSELIGKSHYEVSPNQPIKWREIYQQGLAGETLSCEAERVFGLTKEPIWLEWIIHPWYTINKSIGGIIIYSNIITNRIESENKMKTIVEELKRSNQALDRFAYVCSHDLKEPLRSISNFMQLLFSHNSQHFDEESLTYMNQTMQGINRMNTLIRDILSYSEADGKNEEKILLNINDIIPELKAIFHHQLQEVNGSLSTERLPTILGNPTKIHQLFTNLIGNAIKFHSNEPLNVNVSAIDKGTSWEFHVRDNGIGIPKEHHESIFNMFKRLHSKNKYEGSGIGLATCQKIVHDHQGEIYVQSVPEGGSDFVFTLPKTTTE